jgi:hypothetical protein
MSSPKIHKAPQRQTTPKVSVILLDWGCRERFHALEWLSRQTVPRDDYELLWIELFDRVVPEAMQHADWVVTCGQQGLYHKHKGYNDGLLLARGRIVTVCDSDAVFPDNFIASVIGAFDCDGVADDKPLVLMHHELRSPQLYPDGLASTAEMHRYKWAELWPNAGACMSVTRRDAIRFGGFDEDESYRGSICGPYDLGWRLVNAGLPAVWHDRVSIWHFAHPHSNQSDNEKGWNEIAVPHIEYHARPAVEAFSTGRLLPLTENATILATRLRQRRIGSAFEEKFARMGELFGMPPLPAAETPVAAAAAAVPSSQTALLPVMPAQAARPVQVAATVQPVAASASSPSAAAGFDWRDIPVFIVNRNRHDSLRRLVDWLQVGGTRKIIIMDNASTYAPLLQYYQALPAGVHVMALGENHGPYVLWQQGVHKVLETPYVLTDSDVVPADCCPHDLIAMLHAQLQRFPDAKKVGTALRIDNLPDSYGDVDTVRKWESQFWEHPVAPGIFRAPIDTTFALYPARGEFSNEACNLRLGHPYIAEHTPWYADEAALCDEERYYREHTSQTYSNWSVQKKESWVRKSERVTAFEHRPKVLHFDGGSEYIPGWVNVGTAKERVDIEFDVRRAAGERLPLGDSSIDGIHLSHVLEGVADAQSLLGELHRVAKPNAKLQIRVAHGARRDAWQDPGQQRAWHEGSFAFFAQPALQPGAGDYLGDWQVEAVRLVADPGDPAARDGAGVQDVVATLVAVKPARPRDGSRPVRQVEPLLVTDARIDPAFQPA